MVIRDRDAWNASNLGGGAVAEAAGARNRVKQSKGITGSVMPLCRSAIKTHNPKSATGTNGEVGTSLSVAPSFDSGSRATRPQNCFSGRGAGETIFRGLRKILITTAE